MDKNNRKKIIKKSIINILITTAVVFVIMLIMLSQSANSKSQFMDNLDYDIVLNEDGSATVTETWDLYISHTNTLFRNFDKYTSSNKFKDIVDVTVKDLQTGKQLKRNYVESYHVPDDCYYALYIAGNRKFEIAWGTGMEYKTGQKKYQIKYTVKDVVNTYNDCNEFYWKLLSEENAIPVKNVTGTITMPKNAENMENLKVWGHGPLNGIIQVKSKNQIGFELKNLEAGRMLEVRVVTLEDMFDVSQSKIKNYSYLNSIVEEETKWANEADTMKNYFYIAVSIIYLIAVIINIWQIVKYYKIHKRKDDGMIHTKLPYYRDIPREETATPIEASYLYFFDKAEKSMIGHQSEMVSATILNLALKGYIKLSIKDNAEYSKLHINSKEVYVNILKQGDDLNSDEKAVYKILEGTYKDKKGEFAISEINDFAKKHYNLYSSLIQSMVNKGRESLYKQKLVDKAQKRLYQKSVRANIYFYLSKKAIQVILISFILSFLPMFNLATMQTLGVSFRANFITLALVLLPLIATILIKLKLASEIQNKIAVLTQKGIEEQEQWHALAKYMQDFSLLKEKEVPDLVLWEKYLVYATAFGIADRVIQQMKSNYPEVFVEEYWEDENIQKYQVLNFTMCNVIYHMDYEPMHAISSSVETAYKTSLSEIAAHSSSSGSGGGGGGFSGGGGGRWRWRPVWAEDKYLQKNSLQF